MALHNCADFECDSKASGRNLFCVKSWFAIPEHHRDEIRKGTEKGEHTLRAKPSREWMSKAMRYLHEPRKVPI
jgi:hypothetical protein